MTRTRSLDSPLGPLRIELCDGAITGLFMNEPPSPDREDGQDDPLLLRAARQLDEFFARERRDFDLPLAPAGTPFQRKVWEELGRVAYGETVTYGELARRVGDPNASRAVGLANGRNPISILIPCHRVVGADGKLTGYAGGLGRKLALLDLERGGLFAHDPLGDTPPAPARYTG